MTSWVHTGGMNKTNKQTNKTSVKDINTVGFKDLALATLQYIEQTKHCLFDFAPQSGALKGACFPMSCLFFQVAHRSCLIHWKFSRKNK